MITRREQTRLIATVGVAIGAVTWLWLLVSHGVGPSDPRWIGFMLALGAQVVVPLGIIVGSSLVGADRLAGHILRAAAVLQIFAATALALSLGEDGRPGIMPALAWMIVTVFIGAVGALLLIDGGPDRRSLFSAKFGTTLGATCDVRRLSVGIGFMYLVIGAGWAVFDAFGYRPIGFDPLIVRLTAVHFHFAGFALAIVAGMAAHATGGRVAIWIALAAMLGVPIVAVGITASQLGAPPAVETAAAIVQAVAGAGVAWLLVRLTARRGMPAGVRALLGGSGALLGVGMLFAAAYGVRSFWMNGAPGIPTMWAWHGSALAFGVGVLGLAGWATALTASPIPDDR